MKSNTHKGASYCYGVPRFPSSCFLGHVTGLFFCSLSKIFAKTVYALIDFLSFYSKTSAKTVNIMSLVVLHIECFENKIIKKLGV